MSLRRFKFIGTLAFYVSLPGLYFYLKKDERSRVIVRVGDEILVLKGWYGSNKWMLPGGGMHKNEQAADAAIRELKEETGIIANLSDLEFINSGQVSDSYGLRYTYHLFVLTLPVKPVVDVSNAEIFTNAWYKPEQLVADTKGVLKATRTTLGVWIERKNLIL